MSLLLILLALQDQPGVNVKAPLVESLTLGGRLRERGEWRDPADYRAPGTLGRPATDDQGDNTDFILQRARLNIDAQVVKEVRVYLEIQDSRRWGDEAALNADTADLDLKQGFADFKNFIDEPLLIRIGRMEVPNLGDQRMISSLDWDNVGRSLDGIMPVYTPEGWFIAALAANLREAAVFVPGGDAGDDFWFGSLYVSCRKIADHEFDAYVYVRDLAADAFTSEDRPVGYLGERQDFTFGIRVKGKVDFVDYSAEGAYQIGRQANDPVRAYAWALTLGLTFGIVRIGIEVTAASGDHDPADGRAETFDPILPFGHFYHGHADLVGWRNIQTAMIALRVKPSDACSLHVDLHGFQLDQEKDSWFAATGSAVRRDATGASDRALGSEIDVYAKWKLWERVDFWAGYSHFFAGEFVRDTGFHADLDWFFLQFEIRL